MRGLSLLLVWLAGIALVGAQGIVQDPVAEGQALRAELLAQMPTANTESTGTLRTRTPQGRIVTTPVHFQVSVLGPTAWATFYTTPTERLTVHHQQGSTNRYTLAKAPAAGAAFGPAVTLNPVSDIYASFGGSEFWPADLGLEFFHWPAQRLIKKEMRKGRSCRVLESLNPAPVPGAYARVLSWIDLETNGLVLAEGYDLSGKSIKEFSVRSFKKVEGAWQLKEMEIRNLQNDARTSLIFDLTSE